MCSKKKTEDVNLSVFNRITRINESKTLAKDISCECKCKFDERKYNSNQWWNNDKCWCECEKLWVCEKDYVWNPSKCICQNGKYLASIMVDSANIRDEVIRSYDKKIKTIPSNFNGKKVTCKTQSFYVLLAFLKITILLLIFGSIYCYLIKYQAKNLLPF